MNYKIKQYVRNAYEKESSAWVLSFVDRDYNIPDKEIFRGSLLECEAMIRLRNQGYMGG